MFILYEDTQILKIGDYPILAPTERSTQNRNITQYVVITPCVDLFFRAKQIG